MNRSYLCDTSTSHDPITKVLLRLVYFGGRFVFLVHECLTLDLLYYNSFCLLVRISQESVYGVAHAYDLKNLKIGVWGTAVLTISDGNKLLAPMTISTMPQMCCYLVKYKILIRNSAEE